MSEYVKEKFSLYDSIIFNVSQEDADLIKEALYSNPPEASYIANLQL